MPGKKLKPIAALRRRLSFVTVAALDRGKTSRTHSITPEADFSDQGAKLKLMTSEGTQINLRIIRANGVNTR